MNKKKQWVILAVIIAGVLIAVLLYMEVRRQHTENDILDSQLEMFVTSMNTDDNERFKAAFHPDVNSEDTDGLFADLRQLWRSTEPDAFKPRSVSIRTHTADGVKYGVNKGVWTVEMGDNSYGLTIVYESDGQGSGITILEFAQISEVRGAAYIITVITTIICVIIIIFTAVDIIRSKPHLYILILLTAVCVSFIIHAGDAQIAIPLGSIVYWLARKRLLRAKAE